MFYHLQLRAQGVNNQALDPAKPLSQLIVTRWTIDQGLPSNALKEVHQGHNGYLWVTSYNGLVRFDGAHFKVFDKRTSALLLNNNTYLLRETNDGQLFIGTQGSGLLVYHNGTLQYIGGKEYYIEAFWLEADGRAAWVGTRSEGLFKVSLDKQVFTRVNHPILAHTTITAIGQDAEKRLWISTESQGVLWMTEGNRFEQIVFEKEGDEKGIQDFFLDKEQRFWIAKSDGLYQWVGGKLNAVEKLKGFSVRKVTQDTWGSLWVGTNEGVFRINARTQAVEKLSLMEEDAIISIEDICFDREGSLWATSYRDGLFQAKGGKFFNYTRQEGLRWTTVGSLAAYNTNELLIGTTNGLIDHLRADGTIVPFDVKTPLPKDRIYHLFQDSKKNVWISTYEGLVKKSADGTEIRYTDANGLPDNAVRIVFEDRKGNIWIGTKFGGIARLNQEGKFSYFGKSQGLSSDFIMDIAQAKNGDILVATNNGGINRLSEEGRFKELIDMEKGLASNLVFRIRITENEVIWCASNAGLSRIEGGKITVYDSNIGLPNDALFDILEDQEGNFWMPCNIGIIRVAKAELEAYHRNMTQKNIYWKLFNKGDGMKNEQCAGATHSVKLPGGKFYVPTLGGVLLIDPTRIPYNQLRPMVHINALSVNGIDYSLAENIRVASGNNRFIFDFSGLSFIAPERVRFKFKLENYDTDWVDANTERRAIYTALPPGTYHFRVKASNNDDIWNEEGDVLTITIQPNWHEQAWVRVSLALLMLAGVFVSARKISDIRLKQAERHRLSLERKVQERTQEVVMQKEIIERKNADITASINYAKRIQEAILPTSEEMGAAFPQNFVLYQPRDIVSGDLYWTGTTKNAQNELLHYIAAIDCTGHGVPGAFMSLIAHDLLEETIQLKRIQEPHHILQVMHKSVRTKLKQASGDSRDGMDMSICCYNPTRKTLTFAGAIQPLIIADQGEVYTIKGSKVPIGGLQRELERTFELHTIDLTAYHSPTFYLLSDGYVDQFGGTENRKFLVRNLRSLLSQIHHKPLAEQRQILGQTLKEWMIEGNEEQIDDILVIGFRV
ncbi:two-component regulator propeller domain-containing protein [Eisenibacter elegans]|uniref:two-component regulator propeller domain-containing protein n=1 Tax=Eisenibacter elegans TaxID=997 RepID=UPI0003FBCF39|nr:two-component regulator propeller domain-containing protein [Eisenibacter elegans]